MTRSCDSRPSGATGAGSVFPILTAIGTLAGEGTPRAEEHKMPMNEDRTRIDRRGFVKSAALLAGGAIAPTIMTARANAASPWRSREALRIGVIGCGGRGTGSAVNLLDASPLTRIVALADVFEDRLQASRQHLAQHGERGTVADARCYVGFDAYQQLLDDGEVDIVTLATPPHFRPIHLDAAVRAGVHVFTEKPVAVDPAGIRRVLDAAGRAEQLNLRIVAGTQRRYENVYLEALKRVRDGQIGEIIAASCYWNMGGLWKADRQPEWSDMEYQLRNWLYYTWLSGDHIVEQHVHNLDVINWFTDATPARCLGMGGRQVRTSDEYGHVFDHFAVEYEYDNGIALTSFCRQIDGCDGRVQERIRGTKGTLTIQPGWARITGDRSWQFEGDNPNPYLTEQQALVNAIIDDTPRNDLRNVAHSTLTAIMGRMSAYTGKEVAWDTGLNSELDLSPPAYTFGPLESPRVAVPGRTPLI